MTPALAPIPIIILPVGTDPDEADQLADAFRAMFPGRTFQVWVGPELRQ